MFFLKNESDKMSSVAIVKSKFVVIGGGIAGICCAEELCRLRPLDKVTLITASDVVKAVANWKQMGKVMETFDVQEKHIHNWTQKASNLNIVKATVSALNAAGQIRSSDAVRHFYFSCKLHTGSGTPFQTLCTSNCDRTTGEGGGGVGEEIQCTHLLFGWTVII